MASQTWSSHQNRASMEVSQDQMAQAPEEELPPSFLPPFANVENKELDLWVRRKEKELAQCEATVEEHRDRVTVMEEHLRNVQTELVYTQQRLNAKKKETDTEEHLKQLSKREAGRLEVEMRSLEEEAAELEDKKSMFQNSIFRGNEKMDQFRLLMNWNQEELEQWALAARQKEEDNQVLQKYSKQDNQRVKELNLNIEKMAKELHKKRKELGNEVTETQSAQIQLDKTAEDFRALHAERQELIRQWEEASNAIRRRDKDIQHASERFADNKERLRVKKQGLDSRATTLETEASHNRDLESQSTLSERKLAKLKSDLDAEGALLSEVVEEMELLKATLTRAANDLAEQRSQHVLKEEELEAKRNRLEVVKRRLLATQKKVEGEFSTLDTLEKRSAELTKLHANEEARLKAVTKEVAELKDKQFKVFQELHGLRGEEKDLIAEINGCQLQNRNMADKLRQLDGVMVKQAEVLYNAEFQIQAMERKVARASGERSDSEKRELTRRIEQIQAVLDEKNAEHLMLTAQVKRSEEDLSVARRKNEEASKEAGTLQTKIAELALESDTVMRRVKQTVKEKEDKIVAHDILRLEVRRLQDILGLRADEVFGLENRKLQLHLSMEERRQDVQAQREVLRAQLKAVLEDVHRATLEKKERGLKVAKLQAKYDVLVGRMKKEEGEEHSQAYYVIKAAQERESLQREGDQLDAQIRQMETETKALETTLGKLNEKNSEFRSSFRSSEAEKLTEEQGKLRQALDRTYDRVKLRRSEEQLLQQDMEHYHQRLANLAKEEAQVGASMEELGRRVTTAERELQEQLEKSKRASRRVEKLMKRQREKGQPPSTVSGVEMRSLEAAERSEPASRIEQELALAELRDGNREALQELRAVCIDNPSVAPLIEAAVAQVGLKLPLGSTSSSRASSRAGSGIAGNLSSSRRSSVSSSLSSRNSSRSSVASRASLSSQVSGKSGVTRAPSIKNMQLQIPQGQES